MSANVNSDTPAIAFDVDNGYHKFTSDELAIMERLKERMKGVFVFGFDSRVVISVVVCMNIAEK